MGISRGFGGYNNKPIFDNNLCILRENYYQNFAQKFWFDNKKNIEIFVFFYFGVTVVWRMVGSILLWSYVGRFCKKLVTILFWNHLIINFNKQSNKKQFYPLQFCFRNRQITTIKLWKYKKKSVVLYFHNASLIET